MTIDAALTLTTVVGITPVEGEEEEEVQEGTEGLRIHQNGTMAEEGEEEVAILAAGMTTGEAVAEEEEEAGEIGEEEAGPLGIEVLMTPVTAGEWAEWMERARG